MPTNTLLSLSHPHPNTLFTVLLPFFQLWEVAPVMVATLTCDHRVVDGAVGAQWLGALKTLVENPTSMLL